MSLADRVAACTMRPTSMPELWQRIADHHLVQRPTPKDLFAVFRGCDALALYQAAGGPVPGALYVIVRYPNGTMVWGVPKHRVR